MCVLVLLNNPNPPVHHSSLNHQYIRIVNTQIPPVEGKLGQHICSSTEQTMSRKHTKAPFLENRFKGREKKPQAQHDKTNCYGLLLRCMWNVSFSSSIGISIELLSFGVNFKCIQVNKLHGLPFSNQLVKQWSKDHMYRWAEFKHPFKHEFAGERENSTLCYNPKEAFLQTTSSMKSTTNF